MKILLVHPSRIPVYAYGGTERVVWDLAKGLLALGHEVTFLVSPGSTCAFAPVLTLQPDQPVLAQIPKGQFDIVHFQFHPGGEPDFPYVVTEHGNAKGVRDFLPNTVFVSRDHAQRHGFSAYVYNGLDWAAYGPVDWQRPRDHYHFLGKGAWSVKNLKGAIQVARQAQVPLAVLGGTRLNLVRGFRWTPWPSIRFYGMVGGEAKQQLLNQSKGLVLPVRWHEPFGLAVIESLYFGCPVFATPYGALPELVNPNVGVLSTSAAELANAVRQQHFDAQACHQHAQDHFGHVRMAQDYVTTYQRVLDGQALNPAATPLDYNGHQRLPWHA